MRGDFKINDVWYRTYGGLPNQTLANQMTSKSAMGDSKYSDLQNWSAWIISQDLQRGIGNLDPATNGGALYSECETRVPSQLILSSLPRQVDTRERTAGFLDSNYTPEDFSTYWTISSDGTTTKAAVQFRTPAALTDPFFWAYIYCRALPGTTFTYEVRANSAGSPGAVLLSGFGATTNNEVPSFCWVGAPMAYAGTLSAATTYWLCIHVTSGTMDIAYGSSGYDVSSKLLTSSSWVESTGNYMFYATNVYHLQQAGDAGDNGSGFFRFSDGTDSQLYCYTGGGSGGAVVYKYIPGDDCWNTFTAANLPVLVSSHADFLNKMWLASARYASTQEASTMAENGTAAASGFEFCYIKREGGYLWAADFDGLIYYSDDGVTFVNYPEMTVGTLNLIMPSAGDYAPVTGMEGMGDDMFISTAQALYRSTAGDFVVPVCKWGSLQQENGRAMVEHEGNLYVTADNRIYMIGSDMVRQDIWMTREDDMLSSRLGPPQALCVANSWVLALCGDGGNDCKPTIWALQDFHWHHVATLPDASTGNTEGLKNYSMYYDAITSHLWIMTPQRLTYKLYIPGTTINPYNDPDTLYAPNGWIEWDWFDGPVLEEQKDYDSVAIIGENFSANRTAKVYWKDDESTAWEFLGTVTSNYQELRWSIDGNTRPNTRRLKLGILLSTNDADMTPRVRAIRVKYHLMVRDRFRWALAIDVSGRSEDRQMMADGTRNTITASEIKDTLDGIVKSVPPVVYEDVDGKAFEVKILDANFTYTRNEYIEQSSTQWWEGVYRITLEQVTEDEYTPA